MGRHILYNTQTFKNIMHSKHPDIALLIAISMDAEKAVDKAEWEYLFAVLKAFGFAGKCINWVKLLYTAQQASVPTNDIHSEFFPLERGTCQGCPLSPSLFALAIEPLAISLRSSTLF